MGTTLHDHFGLEGDFHRSGQGVTIPDGATADILNHKCVIGGVNPAARHLFHEPFREVGGERHDFSQACMDPRANLEIEETL